MDMSRTTRHRRMACCAKPCEPSRVRRVVLEHAQNFPTVQRESKQSLPPFIEWMENSDIFRKSQIMLISLSILLILFIVFITLFFSFYKNPVTIGKATENYQSLEELTDAADQMGDMLWNSPGHPYDWERLSSEKIKKIGLVNVGSHTLNLDRLNRLYTLPYEQLKKLMGTDVDFIAFFTYNGEVFTSIDNDKNFLGWNKNAPCFGEGNGGVMPVEFFNTLIKSKAMHIGVAEREFSYPDGSVLKMHMYTFIGDFPKLLSECCDNIDNDADGLMDYPDDPGCKDIFYTDEESMSNSSLNCTARIGSCLPHEKWVLGIENNAASLPGLNLHGTQICCKHTSHIDVAVYDFCNDANYTTIIYLSQIINGNARSLCTGNTTLPHRVCIKAKPPFSGISSICTFPGTNCPPNYACIYKIGPANEIALCSEEYPNYKASCYGLI